MSYMDIGQSWWWCRSVVHLHPYLYPYDDYDDPDDPYDVKDEEDEEDGGGADQ